VVIGIVGFAAMLLVSIYITSLAATLKVKQSGSKLCFSCHEEEQNNFDKKYVHSPIAQDNCVVCHNPHTGKYQFMLSEKFPTLCYSCHADEREKFSKKPHIHTAVRQGKCTGCHNPHASDNERLQEKTGKELCYSCHQREIPPNPPLEKGGRGDFEKGRIHYPVELGQCLICHEPHASRFKSQLRDSPEQLCFTCHDKQEEVFKKAHGQYPVAKSDCLTCHAAHASDVKEPALAKGLILPYVHVPFGKKKCDSCHVSSNSKEPLKLRATQTGLCYRCHSDMKNEVRSQTHVHIPVKDGSCTSCHVPHASKNEHLLVTTGKELCACHTDVRKKLTATYAHSPVAQGLCVKCHNPHVSSHDSLLVNDSIALCASCHKAQGKFTHPVGKGTIAPRTKKIVTCVSCHEAHGSEHEFILLADKQRDLCIRCHRM